MLDLINSIHIFALANAKKDLLAQLVEQRPFKAWALGSSPRGITETQKPSIFRGFCFFRVLKRVRICFAFFIADHSSSIHYSKIMCTSSDKFELFSLKKLR